MTDKDIEFLCEGLSNEIEEIKELLNNKNISFEAKRTLGPLMSNLRRINDKLYELYEKLPEGEIGAENKILEEILREKLTWEEKIDLKINHRIDLR